MTRLHPIYCAIFCHVIDNFGDIGVCWRLATQLQQEHHLNVHLWIDDLHAFKQLEQSINTTATTQCIQEITVHQWQHNNSNSLTHSFAITSHFLATQWDLVIDGFSCQIPLQFIQHMAVQAHPPVWINLDYLCLESWGANYHLQPSIHPTTGLVQYFWIPGFTPQLGGLLRNKQNTRNASASQLRQFKLRNAIRVKKNNSTTLISLFAYPSSSIHSLLDGCCECPNDILLLVPNNKALNSIESWPHATAWIDNCMQVGNLTIQLLPFLPQQEYDQLLALCDLNIVRGEDSLVRAIWAKKPFIWHIYPERDDAHLTKLNAFIQSINAITPLPAAINQCLMAWNTLQTLDWKNIFYYVQTAPPVNPSIETSQSKPYTNTVWQSQIACWQQYLLQQHDLCSQLMQFFHQHAACKDFDSLA